MLNLTRRKFVVGAGGVVGAAALSTGFGMPAIRRSYGQGAKSVVFASGGALTGSFDPTSHTVLPQINFEGFVFGRLFRTPMRADNPGEIVPELALGQTIIDDHTLEYQLRQGVTFHHGQPFSAKDIKATFEYASHPDRPAASWYPGQVEVEVIDDYTVRLHTENFGYPASSFWFLSSFLPIVSAEDVESGALADRPNGTGPFQFVGIEGDQTRLAAFDSYYDGRPAIDEVIFSYVPDANTRVLGLMNGDFHIIERLEPEQFETLEGEGNVRTSRTISTENKYLHFRCNKPPFDDPLVRLAACHAIDRDLINQIMGVAGHPSSSYISPVKFGYADIPDYPAYDPDRARQLLADAGYPGGQGLPELEFITSTGFYPKTREYGELIVALWQEVGLPVNMNVLEPAAWESQIYLRPDGSGPGHICDVGWATGSPEPDLVLRPMWHSSAALVNGINDPEIDAVLDKEQAATDPQTREQILQTETLPTIARKVPSFSLFTSVLLHGLSSELEGAYFYPNGPIDLSKAELKS